MSARRHWERALTRDKLNDVVIAVLRDLHPGDLEAEDADR